MLERQNISDGSGMRGGAYHLARSANVGDLSERSLGASEVVRSTSSSPSRATVERPPCRRNTNGTGSSQILSERLGGMWCVSRATLVPPLRSSASPVRFCLLRFLSPLGIAPRSVRLTDRSRYASIFTRCTLTCVMQVSYAEHLRHPSWVRPPSTVDPVSHDSVSPLCEP